MGFGGGFLFGLEVLDNLFGHLGIQQDLTLIHPPNGVQQFLGVGVLEHVAPCPGFHCLENVAVLAVHGQHDHLGLGPFLEDFLGGLHAIETGHLDIHQDDIGVGLEGVAQGLTPILGLAHDLEIGFRFQKAFKPLAKEGMVVGK